MTKAQLDAFDAAYTQMKAAVQDPSNDNPQEDVFLNLVEALQALRQARLNMGKITNLTAKAV